MNEHYAMEPIACESADDLRHLLKLFGPYAGRYLAEYPTDWLGRVGTWCSDWSEVEKSRVSALLRRAKANLAVVHAGELPWSDTRNWIENAADLKRPPKRMEEIVVARINRGQFPSVDEFDPPLTAGELVVGNAREFVRVSRTLLLESREIAFIDHFLNPCREDVFVVLREMLREVAKGRCRRVICWARRRTITDAKHSIDEVLQRLRALRVEAGYPIEKSLEFKLIDDRLPGTKTRMHARYLLSKYGAIHFDQGFQEQGRNISVAVSVVPEAIHSAIFDTYFQDDHDMSVVDCLNVNAG